MDQPPPDPTSTEFGSTYPSAWYPDPTHRFEFRYHNGTQWTGDVSVNGHRFVDHLPTFPPTTVGAAPPPFGVAPVVPVGAANKSGAGLAIAGFVLALTAIFLGWVPFIAALTAIAAIVAVVFAILFLVRARRRADGAESTSSPRGRGFAIATLVLAPLGMVSSGVGIWLTTVVYGEVDDFLDVGTYKLDQMPCSAEGGLARFSGTITNTSSKTHTYRVEIDFVRQSDGVVLNHRILEAADVAPGDDYELVASLPVQDDDVDCDVGTVTGPLPFDGGFEPDD